MHVEIQYRPAADMGRRTAEYGVRLARAYADRSGPHAAVQIVVQITGPPMPTLWEWAGITGTFHRVHIPTLKQESLLATPALAPFALVGSGSAVVPDVAAHLAAVQDPGLQRSLFLLAMRLASTLADTIIEALRRNPMSTEIIVERLLTSDIGQTIREQGIEQGAATERRSAVLAILRHRFTDADPDRTSRTAGRLTAAATTSPDASLDAAFAVEDLDS